MASAPTLSPALSPAQPSNLEWRTRASAPTLSPALSPAQPSNLEWRTRASAPTLSPSQTSNQERKAPNPDSEWATVSARKAPANRVPNARDQKDVPLHQDRKTEQVLHILPKSVYAIRLILREILKRVKPSQTHPDEFGNLLKSQAHTHHWGWLTPDGKNLPKSEAVGIARQALFEMLLCLLAEEPFRTLEELGKWVVSLADCLFGDRRNGVHVLDTISKGQPCLTYLLFAFTRGKDKTPRGPTHPEYLRLKTIYEALLPIIPPSQTSYLGENHKASYNNAVLTRALPNDPDFAALVERGGAVMKKDDATADAKEAHTLGNKFGASAPPALITKIGAFLEKSPACIEKFACELLWLMLNTKCPIERDNGRILLICETTLALARLLPRHFQHIRFHILAKALKHTVHREAMPEEEADKQTHNHLAIIGVFADDLAAKIYYNSALTGKGAVAKVLPVLAHRALYGRSIHDELTKYQIDQLRTMCADRKLTNTQVSTMFDVIVLGRWKVGTAKPFGPIGVPMVESEKKQASPPHPVSPLPAVAVEAPIEAPIEAPVQHLLVSTCDYSCEKTPDTPDTPLGNWDDEEEEEEDKLPIESIMDLQTPGLADLADRHGNPCQEAMVQFAEDVEALRTNPVPMWRIVGALVLKAISRKELCASQWFASMLHNTFSCVDVQQATVFLLSNAEDLSECAEVSSTLITNFVSMLLKSP